MERNLLIAGFGGQGIMSMGKLLAKATCYSTDKNITFFPSYGAQMRGGTANCYVVISDDAVGAPVPDKVDDLVVMNGESLNRFIGRLKKGGNLFVNSTIVTEEIKRDDVNIIRVPATSLALELGSGKVLNIIMLGAYIAVTEAIPENVVLDTILNQFAKKPKFIPMNKEAWAKGLELGKAN